MKMECTESEAVEDESTPRRRSRNRKFIKLAKPEPGMVETKTSKLAKPEPGMFETKTSIEDTCLKLDGNSCLYASSSILSLASPTFKSQIEEKASSKVPLELELNGKRYKDVLEFLKCIYPSIMQRLSMKNIPIVLPLAFEYGVKPLTKNCEAVIIEEFERAKVDGNCDPDDICLYLAKAFEYNLPDLQKTCLELAVDNYDDLPRNKVKSLPMEAKAELQGRVIAAMKKEMEAKNKEIHAKNKIIEARNKDIEAKNKENISLTKFAELKGARGLRLLMCQLYHHPMLPRNPRVGYLEYAFSVHVKGERTSLPITIHGINWTIDVSTKETALEVYLFGKMSKACTCSQSWNCRVSATMGLHNFKDIQKTITKSYVDNIFQVSQYRLGYKEFAKMEEILDKDRGFIKDGMARFEVYMYAEEPTFE